MRGWEGVDGKPVLRAYRDGGGVWTIAYGRTRGVRQGDACTAGQAEQWLADEVGEVSAMVDRCIKVSVNQSEFDGLVALAYNIGSNAFAGSTLLRLLNAGDYTAAAAQFARWDHDNGVEVEGLKKRRAAEHDIFANSNYQGRP